MSTDPLHVVKHGVPMLLSAELLADSLNLPAALIHAALTTPPTTPEEAAARREQATRERVAERQAAVPIALTLGVLVERMGWSTAYATHLVQPYCRCGDYGVDGEWVVCEHAYDLGVTS